MPTTTFSFSAVLGRPPSGSLRALTLLTAAVCAGRCFGFSLELDEPSGIYPEGKAVTLTVKGDASSKLEDLEKVVVLANGLKQLEISVTKTEPVWQGQFTPPSPGWYVFEARRKDQSGKEKPSAVGILVAPEKLEAIRPEPADFDAFWKGKRNEISAVPSESKLTPLLDQQKEQEYTSGTGRQPRRVEEAERLEKEGMERWNLEIPMPAPVNPVHGYLARPAKAESKSCPVIILLHAAGWGQFWARGNSIEAMKLAQKYHAIVLDLSAHGILNGGTPEYYAEWEKKLSAQYKNPLDWNSTQLAGMAMRLIRAIDYAASLPEWDGKHIVCMGESQGGGQALTAAGLDPRVSAVVALVPAMCDFAGPTSGRPAGYPYPVNANTMPEKVEPLLERVLHCDNIYLSKRSRAKTLIFAGLIDVTCPSPGIAAAYNAIPGEKKILFYPHKPHHDFPDEDRAIGEYYPIKDAFLADHFAK